MISPLQLLTPTPSPSGAGCARAGSCGLPTAGLDEATRARVATHPCYSQEAHQYYARMHLAVAPGCNVQCHYCNRKFDCVNESRPGVTSQVLSPEEALAKVAYVAAKVPQLSVVGIAGPGDPLVPRLPRLRAEPFGSRNWGAALPPMLAGMSASA